MDFSEVAQYPPFYQLAIGIGLAFGGALLVLFIGWGKYRQLSVSASDQSVRLSDIEARHEKRMTDLEARYEKQLSEKDIAWQTRLEDALAERDRQHGEKLKRNNEALQADFATQLTNLQKAQSEQDRKREDAHTERLQVISANFASLQSAQTSTLEKNRETLEIEIALRQAAQSENELLRSTLENLNARIDGLENELRNATGEIKRLSKSNNDHEAQEESLKKIIAGLKEEFSELQHKYDLLKAENDGILKMATAFRLKLMEGNPEDGI